MVQGVKLPQFITPEEVESVFSSAFVELFDSELYFWKLKLNEFLSEYHSRQGAIVSEYLMSKAEQLVRNVTADALNGVAVYGVEGFSERLNKWLSRYMEGVEEAERAEREEGLLTIGVSICRYADESGTPTTMPDVEGNNIILEHAKTDLFHYRNNDYENKQIACFLICYCVNEIRKGPGVYTDPEYLNAKRLLQRYLDRGELREGLNIYGRPKFFSVNKISNMTPFKDDCAYTEDFYLEWIWKTIKEPYSKSTIHKWLLGIL